MRKQKTDLELLGGKLRLPIHISYISKYILKKTVEETEKVLQEGIEMGLIEESHKGYFQLKKQQ